MTPAGVPPRTLLTIDAVGAGLSMVFLGAVLRSLMPVTGLPTEALTLLAILPTVCISYDLACLLTRRADAAPALWPIALMNITYVCVTMALLRMHAAQVTVTGWCYFSAELLIVLALAAVQMWTARPSRAGGSAQ